MSTLAELEKHADEIRKELAVPKQNEVFAAAAEAAYLAAMADGAVSDDEHEALVKAIGILSVGAIIEWEVEDLLERHAASAEKDGADARATAVGGQLKELGQPEPALLFAAFVAQASGGIDKKESGVLHAIGKAAGIAKNKVTAILKRVGAKAAE
jgi:tellurite resistance protein